MNVSISMYGALLALRTSVLRPLVFSSANLSPLSTLVWIHVRSTPRLATLSRQQHSRFYAKKAKKPPTSVQLAEGERDVINLEKVEGGMAAVISSLKHEYTTSVVTRITPSSLDTVRVEVEGQIYPLRKIAQLGMPNPQTIMINMSAYPESVKEVASALSAADLGLNPLVEKNMIRIPIPKITGELRESLVKLAKSYAEKAKVGVRKVRQKGMSDLKKQKTTSSDTIHRLEKYVQQLADNNTATIDNMLDAKTTELTKAS